MVSYHQRKLPNILDLTPNEDELINVYQCIKKIFSTIEVVQ